MIGHYRLIIWIAGLIASVVLVRNIPVAWFSYSDDKDDKFDRALEEYKMVSQRCSEYFTQYIQSLVVYFAIMGVLLKFFFDAPTGSDSRFAFFAAGYIVTVAALTGLLDARRSYRLLSRRSGELSTVLNMVDISIPPGRTMRMQQYGIFGILACWMLLLFVSVQPPT
jgi:hypothetical protein